MKIKFYIDPGHGWFAVKRAKLEEFGIADKISAFSYERGKTVYLEEDRDADLFLKELIAAGVEYEIVAKYSNARSPIRSYDSYRGAA